MPEENIYGDNAIIGNKEDATNNNPLQDRDVEIKTSETQTFQTKTDQQNDETKVDEVPKEDATSDVDTKEKEFEATIQNQLKADEDAKKDLEAKGVDFNAIANEYETNGALGAETLAQLEKAGYPKSVVDAYIAGMEATAEKFESTVFGYAGGQEQFQQLAQFVKSMGQSYVDAFNTTIQTGNLTQIQIAINGFKAQMTSKFGSANRSIIGCGLGPVGVQGFDSKASMVSAMSDPRYGRDPGYTREVQSRTMKTNF